MTLDDYEGGYDLEGVAFKLRSNGEWQVFFDFRLFNSFVVREVLPRLKQKRQEMQNEPA
ncbi:DUF3986 family protein [Candidatus Woesearchaeota archaeon]|nr:DUF3986 family protein [Candidatus Woesearchaeota archaeon]